MKFAKPLDNTYILRFFTNEEFGATLKKFCKDKNIHNAYFSGLGTLIDPTLAHYRMDSKKYSEKKLTGIFEVTNITGNIGLFENEPLVHAHVTLSDEEMNAIGGHLVNGPVSATMEIILINLLSSYKKEYEEKIGLKLWQLPEE